MPLISYDASVGINKKTKPGQQQQKLHQKIALITSTTMTIAGIVAKTSPATTQESANKSSDYWSAGNYHIVVLSKKKDG
jgi:hypothetical protein